MSAVVRLIPKISGRISPASELGVGGRIGRSALAELTLAHGAISEFHAYVVHRDEGLVLMASTTSPFLLDGERVAQVVLHPGQRIGLTVDVELEVAEVRLGRSLPVPKTSMTGRIPTRLVVRLRSDASVVVEPEGGAPVAIDGVLANMVVALLDRGRPTHWSILARRLWPQHDGDAVALERNWYRNLGRLRRVLADGGLRPDLVRSSGGNVELFLWANDAVERCTD